MKKLAWILAALLIWPTVCGAWSINDFTTEEKEKLAGIESGAEANEPLVSQSDAEAGTSETEYSWSPLRVAQAIAALASSASNFLGLSDTPSSYSGQGGKVVTVKTDETGLEFTSGNGITEEDPEFNLWLSTTPPIMAEQDPFFTEWLSTFVDSVGPTYSFGTGLSEVDGHVICTVVPYSDSDIDGNESAFNGWDKNASDDFSGAYSDLSGIPSTFAPSGHASNHAVGGSDTIFPADPGADKVLAWDDDPGELVWQDAGTGTMTNPMTTAGDIIYGGASGAPTRLAKGANNTFLGLDGSGELGWQSSLSLDDSAAQFYNAAAPTKLAKILCSGITAGQTRTMTWPDFDFTPAVLGSNLVPASSYYNFGTVAGSSGYGLRDNAGTIEYKNSTGDWAGIGTGGGGTSAGAQYDIQIADAASGFSAVTGEFKYQDHTLSVGTGGISQAKTPGQAGFFELYSNNSTDTTGAGLKGPSATLANSYYLIFPSAEPAATAIWAHAAASSHDSAGSWLYPGTSANNIVQLDGSAKLPAIDGSNLTNVTSTPNDTGTIYDSDGGTVATITKNNTIVILGAAGSVTPKTPAAGVNLMVQNAPGTTGAITIVNLSGVYYGKADASGYITVNHKYVSGGASTDRIVLIGIDSTHYIVSSATGTWTDTAP